MPRKSEDTGCDDRYADAATDGGDSFDSAAVCLRNTIDDFANRPVWMTTGTDLLAGEGKGDERGTAAGG